MRRDGYYRAYLTIGREVFHAHPSDWTPRQWEQATEFIALLMLENEELSHGNHR